MKTARELALITLDACARGGAWAGSYLSDAVLSEEMDARESALALRLCYGVLQNRALLDFYLSHFCTSPYRRLEEQVRNCLRIGAYQLLFLDKIPSSAAVNESVNLAKKYGRNPRAPGLVNAILRTLDRNRDKLPELPSEDPEVYLALKYSHPEWFVKELCLMLGSEGAEQFLAADNAETPSLLQINTLRTTATETEKQMKAQKANIRPHSWLKDCLELREGGRLERYGAFSEGAFWVQDAAARLSVLAASPEPGWNVLDTCSAPGGKSFAAALDMENQGKITACDIHPRKLRMVEEGAARLGLTCIETCIQDAGAQKRDWANVFDLVIADLPCSGFGVIRKKPDIRYRPKELLAGLPGLQCALLDNVSGYVRPGGVLLYSTCTVFSRENEDVVHNFLKMHTDFSLEAFHLPGPAGMAEKGYITLWPHLHETDGFFIAKMRKK